MNKYNSFRSLVATTFIPKLNSLTNLPLIEKCGGIESFFQESDKAITALCRDFNTPYLSFDRHKALADAEKELSQIEKYNIGVCSYGHIEYPALLKQCEDVPIVFYYKGNLSSSGIDKYFAIVGTRHASIRYQNRVETVISELCAMGHHPAIVSGLAFGIDASAHRAALKHNLITYAVLGHGLHMIYPAAHKTLAEDILKNGGALISEFPCLSTIHQSNFLRRNRIIAGLSHATLVAESAIKGGAMSTARIALSYNRDVLAFPGRPDDKWSSGCNRLIKTNSAALVENGTDIAHALNLQVKTQEPVQTSLNLFGDDNNTLILNILEQNENLHIDELAYLSGISSNELSASLLQLELEGKIIALPGKKFSLS